MQYSDNLSVKKKNAFILEIYFVNVSNVTAIDHVFH